MEVKRLCDVCKFNAGQYRTCNDGSDCQEAANEIVPKLYKEIEELKKENQILIKGEYARCCKTCCAFDEQEAIARDYYNECEELKKQLAEKEKEIKSYEHTIDQYEHDLEVYKHNDNLYANSIRRFANKNNQDKISFAVEQLEKVKEEMDLRPRGVSKGWKDKEYDTLVEEDVYEIIDNQIKQLKEMK